MRVSGCSWASRSRLSSRPACSAVTSGAAACGRGGAATGLSRAVAGASGEPDCGVIRCRDESGAGLVARLVAEAFRTLTIRARNQAGAGVVARLVTETLRMAISQRRNHAGIDGRGSRRLAISSDQAIAASTRRSGASGQRATVAWSGARTAAVASSSTCPPPASAMRASVVRSIPAARYSAG